jgi:type III pantothenate kinase
MVLTLDIGNTRIKGAVFENDNIVGSFVKPAKNILPEVKKIFEKFPEIDNVVSSSVSHNAKNLLSDAGYEGKITEIHHGSAFPFVNAYATPQTLGVDRMVLSAGATLMFPSQPRLVIDAGTCVTYDFVDADNIYHGGAISPGLRMRYEAMHMQTARLPLLSTYEPTGITGDSTAMAMHSGAVNGLRFEIDGFVSAYCLRHPNIIIILTGGDSDFLAKRLKNTIFANSNFLLESLNHTFHYLNRK